MIKTYNKSIYSMTINIFTKYPAVSFLSVEHLNDVKIENCAHFPIHKIDNEQEKKNKLVLLLCSIKLNAAPSILLSFSFS